MSEVTHSKLVPRNDSGAPTLTLAGRTIQVQTPDGSGKSLSLDGPDAAAVLASYLTFVKTVRTSDNPYTTKSWRVGLRLETADGRVLAWLANADLALYTVADVEAFAEGAGLRRVDHGTLEAATVRRQGKGAEFGPGTSKVGSWVAPPRQFALAAAVLAGLFIGFPWAVIGLVENQDAPLIQLGAALLGFASLFLGVGLGTALGVLVGVLRERRWVKAHPSPALRPSNAPAVAVIPQGNEVLVIDPFDRHYLPASGQQVTISPYSVPRKRWPQGVVIEADGNPPLVVPGRFAAQDLTSFCSTFGLRLGAEITDPGKVPAMKKSMGKSLRKFGGHYVRSLSVWWIRLRFLPILVFLAGVALLCLGLAQQIQPAGHIAFTGAGMIMLVPCGWWAIKYDCATEFSFPRSIPTPVPPAGSSGT